jgi:DNA-binding MarR family transcriptional regulator
VKYIHYMVSEADRVAALDRVLELAILVDLDMTRGLAALGLTRSRAHLLWVLHQRGPCTQRELAEALRVSPRNITGLVDALATTGFVSRESHPTDRRATLVQFTEHGAAVARQFESDQQEFARMMFEGIPQRRFSAFVRGLDETLDRLRELVPLGDEADDA